MSSSAPRPGMSDQAHGLIDPARVAHADESVVGVDREEALLAAREVGDDRPERPLSLEAREVVFGVFPEVIEVAAGAECGREASPRHDADGAGGVD